jgi:hypothetical protein
MTDRITVQEVAQRANSAEEYVAKWRGAYRTAMECACSLRAIASEAGVSLGELACDVGNASVLVTSYIEEAETTVGIRMATGGSAFAMTVITAASIDFSSHARGREEVVAMLRRLSARCRDIAERGRKRREEA